MATRVLNATYHEVWIESVPVTGAVTIQTGIPVIGRDPAELSRMEAILYLDAAGTGSPSAPVMSINPTTGFLDVSFVVSGGTAKYTLDIHYHQPQGVDPSYAGLGVVVSGGGSGSGGLPQVLIVSTGSSGDFQSVKAACDSILDSGPTKPYLVWVGPGVYTEQPFTVPAYVKVQGAGWLDTILVAADLTNHFITLGPATVLRDVNLLGPTTAFKAAVHHAPNDARAASVVETTVSRGYYGILSDPTMVRSPLLIQNFVNASAGFVITGLVRGEGYADLIVTSCVAAGPDNTILKGYAVVGPNARMVVNASLFECGGGDAVYADNSSFCTVDGCVLVKGLNAIRIGPNGATRMLVHSTSIRNAIGQGFTKDILMESAAAIVHFDGSLSLSRVDNTIGGFLIASGLNVESPGAGEFVIGTSLLVGSGDYPRFTYPPYAIFDYPKIFADRVINTVTAMIPGYGNRAMCYRLVNNQPSDTTERGWGGQGSSEVKFGCPANFNNGLPGHPDLMGWEGTVIHEGTGRVELAAGLMGYVFSTQANRITEAISIDGFQPQAGHASGVIDRAYCFKAKARTSPGTITKKFSFVSEDGCGPAGIGYDQPEAMLAVNGGIHAGGVSDPGNGNIKASGTFVSAAGNGGVSGSFTTVDGKTITVENGIIVSIV